MFFPRLVWYLPESSSSLAQLKHVVDFTGLLKRRTEVPVPGMSVAMEIFWTPDILDHRRPGVNLVIAAPHLVALVGWRDDEDLL